MDAREAGRRALCMRRRDDPLDRRSSSSARAAERETNTQDPPRNGTKNLSGNFSIVIYSKNFFHCQLFSFCEKLKKNCAKIGHISTSHLQHIFLHGVANRSLLAPSRRAFIRPLSLLSFSFPFSLALSSSALIFARQEDCDRTEETHGG